jgi:hypothetical protein
MLVSPLIRPVGHLLPRSRGRRDLSKQSCLSVDQKPDKSTASNSQAFAHTNPTLPIKRSGLKTECDSTRNGFHTQPHPGHRFARPTSPLTLRWGRLMAGAADWTVISRRSLIVSHVRIPWLAADQTAHFQNGQCRKDARRFDRARPQDFIN